MQSNSCWGFRSGILQSGELIFGRACAQNRAVVNLFRGPNMIEDVAMTMRRLEDGDLKLRVRALDSERALNRVLVRARVPSRAPPSFLNCLCTLPEKSETPSWLLWSLALLLLVQQRAKKKDKRTNIIHRLDNLPQEFTCFHNPEDSYIYRQHRVADMHTSLSRQCLPCTIMDCLLLPVRQKQKLQGSICRAALGQTATFKECCNAMQADLAVCAVAAQANQSMMTSMLLAGTMLNIGTLFSVSAMASAATASFVGASVFGFFSLVNFLKVGTQ